MVYIQCPQSYTGSEPSIFLAGGISNCPNWQEELAQSLAHTSWVLLNPRRENFRMNDPQAAEAQIRWEHHHLHLAWGISFWFPCETLCPITLYELGSWSRTSKPLFIGLHPHYARRLDVEIQTKLARPEITIVYSLPDLADQISQTLP
jgi:hypothetical protein